MEATPVAQDPFGPRITVPILADEGERFAPQAFASVIGKIVPLTMGGEPVGNVRVVAVEVEPDGRRALLTYEPGPA